MKALTAAFLTSLMAGSVQTTSINSTWSASVQTFKTDNWVGASVPASGVQPLCTMILTIHPDEGKDSLPMTPFIIGADAEGNFFASIVIEGGDTTSQNAQKSRWKNDGGFLVEGDKGGKTHPSYMAKKGNYYFQTPEDDPFDNREPDLPTVINNSTKIMISNSFGGVVVHLPPDTSHAIHLLAQCAETEGKRRTGN